jgi:hypothetical protein
MKKLLLILPLVLLLCFTFSCQKQDQVERFMEDGVEVVINHLEPYKLRGEPTNLILEKVLSINTERDDLAEIGLTGIRSFVVDSEGNIFMISPKSKENFIFKFDGKGNYVHSFCRLGQGPGEMPYAPLILDINGQDEILFVEAMKKTLLKYDNSGKFIEQTPIPIEASRIFNLTPLNNGNYFTQTLDIYGEGEILFHYSLVLFDSEFGEISELGALDEPNFYQGQKRQAYFIYCGRVTKEKIFVGDNNTEYEILVFDLDGNLVRKIRKEYKKIPIPKEVIEEETNALDEARRKVTVFPESYPPFQDFFTDDTGRLYVKTYEKGEDSGEYIFDIFNADGVFIGRKSLSITDSDSTRAKQNLLYCKNRKESGFLELVVYKMRWE